jgi:16S rRNA G527 N7-methylase RsmG
MSTAATPFGSALAEALADAPVPPAVRAACEVHFGLLVKWNATHNLTRVTAPAEAARKHYADVLVPLAALAAPPAFVDVGSGAGFPGLLAAALWPQAQVTLVEPLRKRQSFLRLAGGAMGIAPARLALVEPGAAVTAPLVLSRATFSVGLRQGLVPYVAPGGLVCLWGHDHDLTTWAEEVATWDFSVAAPLSYDVPGLEARLLLQARAPGAK